MDNLSRKEQLMLLPPEKRTAFLQSLTEQEASHLLYDWEFNGRPKQLEGIRKFGEWFIWLILAGRGFGKTRTGAEMVRWCVNHGYGRFGIISPTSADIRDVVVEGESGILSISPDDDRPTYEPTKRRLTWRNGAVASLYSAEEPERLRGPQHDAVWIDELAAVSSAEIMQRMYDMAMFGLRLKPKKDPRIPFAGPIVFLTTTPKPVPLVQYFVKQSLKAENRVLITTGSTYENKQNLAPTFFRQISQYEGTTLGRQEIHAEVINLEEMGIVKRSWFRLWKAGRKLPYFVYIIQSYDSAFTEKTHNDPTAHQTWGVFRDSDGQYAVMLLDCWAEHLAYPDLRVRVRDNYFDARYGDEISLTKPDPNRPLFGEGSRAAPLVGQKSDIVLIEEKGSGITLIQDLSRAGIPVRSYNPGKMDKVQRLHAVSHLIANGRCYLLESTAVENEPVSWATDFITEVCIFPNSPHDDQVDCLSQTLALLRDQSFLSIDEEVEEEVYADDEMEQRHRSVNPYSQ